jgi:hypothetical protein
VNTNLMMKQFELWVLTLNKIIKKTVTSLKKSDESD